MPVRTIRAVGLSAAVAAGAALLITPPAELGTGPATPPPAGAVWPQAQRGSVPAQLADGQAYAPLIFIDAHTSAGTARSADGQWLRLVLVGAAPSPGAAPERELRREKLSGNPSFPAFAVEGDTLVWVDGPHLWAAGLRDERPARRLAADLGNARFYHSQYDLQISGGQVRWVAAGPGGSTEVRAVPLTGGPVSTRTVPGAWQLSAWPWLVDGTTEAAGTTRIRNLDTGAETGVSGARARSTTDCSPTWCRVVSLSGEGSRIELMHPDGTAAELVAEGAAETVIADVAPLDRFEVLGEVGPNSAQTGNVQLRIFEVATRRTVQVSPDAGRIGYLNGVLWWSTGNLTEYVWHSLDLRTI